MQDDPQTNALSPDPDSDLILFRSLRYSLDDGSEIRYGRDLFAMENQDNLLVVFYFRHWSREGPDTFRIVSRAQAVRFIREEIKKPGLFSGWNHTGLKSLLPEVYWIE